MADDRIHDLAPSATSALGAAYESALQSLPPQAFEDYSLLRYWLARHLIAAAFAGEQEPDALRRRAIAYVAKWFKPPVAHGITRGLAPSEHGSGDRRGRTTSPASLGSKRVRPASSRTAIASSSRVPDGRPCRFVERCLQPVGGEAIIVKGAGLVAAEAEGAAGRSDARAPV